jgi:cation diffusion facilitator CzcD-associated flavoprotein CzcO
MMFTGVPNMAWIFGYFRASWTLRVDLVGDFVCRLLKHMDETGQTSVTPSIPTADNNMERLDWIDQDNFNSNYLMRAMDKMPKRGTKRDWQHTQDY